MRIPIDISKSNVSQSNAMYYVGVPLEFGLITSAKALKLVDDSFEQLEKYVLTPLSYWFDGTVKWLSVEFHIDADTNKVSRIYIEQDTSNAHKSKYTNCSDDIAIFDESDILVPKNTKWGCMNNSVLCNSYIKISEAGKDIAISCLSKRNSTPKNNIFTKYLNSFEVGNRSKKKNIKIATSVNLIANSNTVKLDIDIHNPNSAMHTGGYWDLGDAGSYHFSSMSLNIPLHSDVELTTWWNFNDDDESQEISTPCRLIQVGSGGDNWNSPNHVDHNYKTSVKSQGFIFYENGLQSSVGRRASPSVQIKFADEMISIYMDKFWEYFPSSIEIDKSSICIGLFPLQSDVSYELQPGEKKRHTVYFKSVKHANAGNIQDAFSFVRNMPIVSLEPTVYESASVVSGFSSRKRIAKYVNLLDGCLDHRTGFASKRDNIDEFGWRHFGDLVADHETWGQKDLGIFCSHYNNQYDPIYGFYIQYISTSDIRWLKLMEDLSKHVLDIDIYDTDDDRSEYNHGLFWHTDHYVQAKTCTHRTYSNKNADIGLSGGPGGEHCYTTGLRFYYFLTGDIRGKSTVLKMTEWIRYYYNGSGTLAEFLIGTVKTDIPEVLALCRGNYVGRYSYEMHRGTGNYIIALIDSYELTSDSIYLEEAFNVVKETASPSDSIEDRNFDNIEDTWFYTIFLQAVIRLLDCFRENSVYGYDFLYCRQLLLHYSTWMVENESPYLYKKEKLEYVNDTWVAQDIRKAMILYSAARYSDCKNIKLIEKSEFFKKYVLDNLCTSDTRHYTRILVILLQNQREYLCERPDYSIYSVPRNSFIEVPNTGHSIRSKCKQVGRRLVKSVKNISVSKEIDWMLLRIKS